MIYRSGYGREPRPRRFRLPIGWIVVLVIIAVIAGGVMWAVKFVQNEISGEDGASDLRQIDIPNGATADDIAEMLTEAGVIKNSFIFRNWLRFFYTGDADFMYGPHEVRDDMDFDAMVEALKTPIISPRETFTITFPEGRTTLGMALDLEEFVDFSADDFLAALNDSYDVPFFNLISNGEKFAKLEGFLYPDTYEFYADSTPQEIIQRMLENFDAKVFQDTELMTAVNSSGYTLEQVVTLASVIEKESGDPAEVYKVSSVFHNRLAENSELPGLQSCATENFVLGVLDYYYQDMKGETTPETLSEGYNTYMCLGLPLGAICNPGALSIDAVLNPEDTSPYVYYYFLMDDTGKTYYGETYYEHLANIDSMVSVNAELAGGIGVME